MKDSIASGHEGRLADNILLFCRTLRHAGLSLGPGRVIEAGNAVLRSGIERRDDFYYALRAVLVSDPAQFRLFDQAFHIYFRNPRLLERMLGILLPTIERVSEDGNTELAVRRLMESLTANDTIDQSGSYSRRELLRHKDFEQMSLQEQSEAKQLLREDIDVIKDVATRRFRPHPFGHRYDLRRSMQLMLRNNGQLIELAKKKRRLRPPTPAPTHTGSDLRYFRVDEQLLANFFALRACAEFSSADGAQLCFRHPVNKHQSPAGGQGRRSRPGTGIG